MVGVSQVVAAIAHPHERASGQALPPRWPPDFARRTMVEGSRDTYRHAMRRRLAILLVPFAALGLATWWPRQPLDTRTCEEVEAADYPAIEEVARSVLQDAQVTLRPQGMCEDEGFPSAAVVATLLKVDGPQDAKEILWSTGWEPADPHGGVMFDKSDTDVQAHVYLYSEQDAPFEVRIVFRVPL